MNASSMSRRAIRRELRSRLTTHGRRAELERELTYRLRKRKPSLYPALAAHMLTDPEIDREFRDPALSAERRQELEDEWWDRRQIRKGMEALSIATND